MKNMAIVGVLGIFVGLGLAASLFHTRPNIGNARPIDYPVPKWVEGCLAWNEPLDRNIGAHCVDANVAELFTFENVGDKELQIGRIDTCCGCLSATADTYRVRIGETFSIQLEALTTPNVPYEEWMAVNARIYFVGHDEPLVVGLKTLVFRELPLVVDFGHVPTNQVREKRFLARGCDGLALTITSVNAEDPRVIVDVLDEKATLEAVPVIVRFDPGEHTGNYVSHIAFVLVDGPEKRMMDVAIRAYVTARIQPQPETLSIGVVRRNEVRRYAIELVSTTGTPFLITEVKSGLDGLESNWKPLNAEHTRHVVNIELTVPRIDGSIVHTLEITTSDKSCPLVIIPIYGTMITDPGG